MDVLVDATGLGLFIAKKIIEFHNGSRHLESEGRNKGTKIYINLPKT